jgi:hypothetical protein
VQCEACHGRGRAHSESARAGAVEAGTIVKAPPEKTCLRCHNEQSPHYSAFFYAAMKGLVHRKARTQSWRLWVRYFRLSALGFRLWALSVTA